MPGKKGNRPWVNMYCQENRVRNVKVSGVVIQKEAKCNSQNYVTEKNKRNTTEKLELNKFCSLCGKVTTHKEGK